MHGALLTCLKGSALSWYQDHPISFGESVSYGALKAALIAEFGREQASQITRLEGLEYKGDMHRFNQEFAKIGSGCKSECPETM